MATSTEEKKDEEKKEEPKKEEQKKPTYKDTATQDTKPTFKNTSTQNSKPTYKDSSTQDNKPTYSNSGVETTNAAEQAKNIETTAREFFKNLDSLPTTALAYIALKTGWALGKAGCVNTKVMGESHKDFKSRQLDILLELMLDVTEQNQVLIQQDLERDMDDEEIIHECAVLVNNLKNFARQISGMEADKIQIPKKILQAAMDTIDKSEDILALYQTDNTNDIMQKANEVSKAMELKEIKEKYEDAQEVLKNEIEKGDYNIRVNSSGEMIPISIKGGVNAGPEPDALLAAKKFREIKEKDYKPPKNFDMTIQKDNQGSTIAERFKARKKEETDKKKAEEEKKKKEEEKKRKEEEDKRKKKEETDKKKAEEDKHKEEAQKKHMEEVMKLAKEMEKSREELEKNPPKPQFIMQEPNQKPITPEPVQPTEQGKKKRGNRTAKLKLPTGIEPINIPEKETPPPIKKNPNDSPFEEYIKEKVNNAQPLPTNDTQKEEPKKEEKKEESKKEEKKEEPSPLLWRPSAEDRKKTNEYFAKKNNTEPKSWGDIQKEKLEKYKESRKASILNKIDNLSLPELKYLKEILDKQHKPFYFPMPKPKPKQPAKEEKKEKKEEETDEDWGSSTDEEEPKKDEKKEETEINNKIKSFIEKHKKQVNKETEKEEPKKEEEDKKKEIRSSAENLAKKNDILNKYAERLEKEKQKEEAKKKQQEEEELKKKQQEEEAKKKEIRISAENLAKKIDVINKYTEQLEKEKQKEETKKIKLKKAKEEPKEEEPVKEKPKKQPETEKPKRKPKEQPKKEEPKKETPKKQPAKEKPKAQANTLPKFNVPSTLPNFNVPSTLPNFNVPSTLPNFNVPSTLPNFNVPSTLPNFNAPDPLHDLLNVQLPANYVPNIAVPPIEPDTKKRRNRNYKTFDDSLKAWNNFLARADKQINKQPRKPRAPSKKATAKETPVAKESNKSTNRKITVRKRK